MAGNRKNALNDLAAGFMSTRPPAFDKFLQQPTITLPTETISDGQQRESSMDETPDRFEQVQEETRVESEKPGNDHSIIHPVLAKPVESVKSISGKQTEGIAISKKPASTTAKPKKLAGPYEEGFLAKTDQHPFNPGDQRIYLKKAHAKILSRLVLYCEHTDRRINLQAIVDNILHHHFEQYASDIKQIDQQLLSLLTQQIND